MSRSAAMTASPMRVDGISFSPDSSSCRRSGRPPLQRLDRHRPLGTGLLEPAQDLHAIEGFAAIVLLDHQRQDLVNPLISCEAAAAAGALTSAAYDLFVVGRSGVDHLVFNAGAERATHGYGAFNFRLCLPTLMNDLRVTVTARLAPRARNHSRRLLAEMESTHPVPSNATRT